MFLGVNVRHAGGERITSGFREGTREIGAMAQWVSEVVTSSSPVQVQAIISRGADACITASMRLARYKLFREKARRPVLFHIQSELRTGRTKHSLLESSPEGPPPNRAFVKRRSDYLPGKFGRRCAFGRIRWT